MAEENAGNETDDDNTRRWKRNKGRNDTKNAGMMKCDVEMRNVDKEGGKWKWARGGECEGEGTMWPVNHGGEGEWGGGRRGRRENTRGWNR